MEIGNLTAINIWITIGNILIFFLNKYYNNITIKLITKALENHDANYTESEDKK